MTDQQPKKRAHLWRKGESGNPKGRPPGAGPAQQLRDALGERLPEVLDTVVAQALAGDIQACRLVLERLVPALRPVEQPLALNLPDASLAEQGRGILRAVAQAELSPDQGAKLIGAVGALAKVVELDEMEARIRALEARSGQEGKQS